MSSLYLLTSPPVVLLARFLSDVNPSEHIGDTDITIANECPSESHLEGVDKVSETWYNNTVEFQRSMYQVYDNQQILRGTFESIYDMEKYIDGIRNDRQESYPKTDRSSSFDYIKQIGWYWDIVPIE